MSCFQEKLEVVKSLSTQRVRCGAMEEPGAPREVSLQIGGFGVRSKDWQDRWGPEYRGIVGPISANEINSIGDGSLWKS